MPNPDPWTTALATLGGPLPAERTQFDRWEDQGWTGPDDDMWSPASDQECADAADRAVGGWGPW